MAKKIIDDVLNTMIADGKPQREMARLFGVSDAAISKRIKKLTQAEPPESFKSLSPKEQKFVLAKLEGKSGTAAALQAYECGSVESAKTIGSRLSGDPDISRAIDDLMHEAGIGRRRRILRLRDLIEAKDMGIAAKGLDMSWKLDGSYVAERVVVEVDFPQMQIDLAKAIEALRAEGGAIPKLTDPNVIDAEA